MRPPVPEPGRVNCAYCKGVNLPGCQECKHCENCKCKCHTCQACSTRAGKEIKHLWGYCYVCRRCTRGQYQMGIKSGSPTLNFCHCHKTPDWYDIPPLALAERRVNQIPRALGLEIELCKTGTWLDIQSIKPPSWMTWQMEHDGSVNGAARELVTCPLIGDRFLKGIGWLVKHLREAGAAVDKSCGLHVHVNAQDLGAFEIRRLLRLYQISQDEIYTKLIAPWRSEVSVKTGKWYCMSHDPKDWLFSKLWQTQDTAKIRSLICTWVFEGMLTTRKEYRVTRKGVARVPTSYPRGVSLTGVPRAKTQKYQVANRYYGLNLHAWLQRRTIEWRHFQGTLQLEELILWPLFCMWMVQLAAELTDQEVLALKGLEDIMTGRWVKPFRTVQVPEPVRTWVMSKLKEATF